MNCSIVNSGCGIIELAFQQFECLYNYEIDPLNRYIYFNNFKKLQNTNLTIPNADIIIYNKDAEIRNTKAKVIMIVSNKKIKQREILGFKKYNYKLNAYNFGLPIYRFFYITLFINSDFSFFDYNRSRHVCNLKDIIDPDNDQIINTKHFVQRSFGSNCIGFVENKYRRVYSLDSYCFNFTTREFGMYYDKVLKRFNNKEAKRIVGIPDAFNLCAMNQRGRADFFSEIELSKPLYIFASSLYNFLRKE